MQRKRRGILSMWVREGGGRGAGGIYSNRYREEKLQDNVHSHEKGTWPVEGKTEIDRVSAGQSNQ